MANKFYQPGEQRASKVRELFSAIAPRYDLINDLQSFGLHRYWKRRLLDLAGASVKDRVLDLCCGTGDVALDFAAHGAKAVALDFSESMLRVAQARATASGRFVTWVNGDVLALPFRSSSFDVVTISYGLRNLADLEVGLREMHRVVRPGGRLLVLDFGKPPNPLLRAAYFAYLRYWIPLFGRVLCGDSATYAYIRESLRQYPAQEGVAAVMQKLHCQRVRIINLLGGVMSINYAEKSR
jgi:demethylmenaquinone methyltransferase/2-methoxy-6-polyprenyl-1,4-benzoquinol methylase